MKNLGLVMLLAAALFAVVVDGRGRVGGVRFGGYTGGGGGGRGDKSLVKLYNLPPSFPILAKLSGIAQ